MWPGVFEAKSQPQPFHSVCALVHGFIIVQFLELLLSALVCASNSTILATAVLRMQSSTQCKADVELLGSECFYALHTRCLHCASSVHAQLSVAVTELLSLSPIICWRFNSRSIALMSGCLSVSL